MTGAPYLRDLEMSAGRRRSMIWRPSTSWRTCCRRCIHRRIISSSRWTTRSRTGIRITHSSMLYSDKTFMGMTTLAGTPRMLDMCAILFGEEYLETHAAVTGNRNGNSPLVWDETMLSAMRAFTVATSWCSARHSSWRGEHPGLTVPTVAHECRGAVGPITRSSSDARPSMAIIDRVGAVRCADGGHPRNQSDEFCDQPDGAVLGTLAHQMPAGPRHWTRNRGMNRRRRRWRCCPARSRMALGRLERGRHALLDREIHRRCYSAPRDTAWPKG